jgi:acetyltransferase-like isoleucine patch superfamily enzyme
MIYNKSADEIRSWPVVDGWRVDPETKTRIMLGNYVRLGNYVTLGNRVTLGNYVRLGNRVTLGDDVMLGNDVTLGDRVTLGNYVTLGDGVRLGNDVTLGNRVTLGNYVTLGDGVRLGNGVTLDNCCSSFKINAERCAAIENVMQAYGTYAASRGLLLYVKWTKPDRTSPGGLGLVTYTKGAIIREPKAVRSDKQCAAGLHVLPIGLWPEHAGLVEPGHNWIPVVVGVKPEHICYAGMPGHSDKIRVSELEVLS